MTMLDKFIVRENCLRVMKEQPKLVKPTTFEECKPHFKSLTGEYSPEQLACDGEASMAERQARLVYLDGVWMELEKISGRKVEHDDAWDF